MSWELFERVRDIGLPAGGYAIFGSGPMAVRGLRDCRDIDVIVIAEVFDEYKGASGWDIKELNDVEYLFRNDVELWKEWGPGEWDIKQLIEDSEVIEGLPFVRLTEVLKWKKILKREKDLKDIEILEAYFKRQSMAKSGE
ncbi:hypothetical protein M1506_03695 [Patescibacteria group bacterium]|nr:hypothetical protein [Patescibacteria group bacterium]